ncbi:MAG: GHKL domain-containing protein [Schwartzia sp.]|nr:GHKL domain-containing protein [Schwartzia sp. (in: firmicutes)]
MALAIWMAVGLTLVQAIGAYLRYLPFEAKLAQEERDRLWKYILLWMPVSCVLYYLYFSYAGVTVGTFKHVHYLGWVPFFSFSLVVIRNEGLRHTFVAGMQTLWFMLLQTISGTLILTLLPPEYGAGTTRLPVQTALYIVFFLLLLPVEWRIFRNLLPPTLFVDKSWASWCFAILPFGLCAAPLITLIERPLMYSWADRFSRFFLLFWGFSLYQYSLYAGKRAAKMQEEQHTNELLKQQLHALESQALLLEARAHDVRRVRHDLRHYNRLLASLLDSGNTDMARQMIEEQDKELLAEPIAMYCKSPVVNAALTVYVQMARKEGIRVSCGIDLDAAEGSRENYSDLAILLSNVIENAVIASRKQPEDQREIVISLLYDGEQYALAVKNRFDAPVSVGDDGLPTTEERGHGTGMVSLRNFGKKYDAETIFSQSDGWAKILVYWGRTDAQASDGSD